MELQPDKRITTPNLNKRDVGKSTIIRLNFENESNLGIVIMVNFQFMFNKGPNV